MCANCLHGVAFLSWNQHPEPTGSRRATPLLIFQQKPGHPHIEKPVGVGLFVLKTFTLTEFIRLFVWNWKDKLLSFPDWCVFGVTVALAILFWTTPPGSVLIASYLLFSIIVYLLNVVLLDHKVFGAPRSPERSLILFILNVAQVVLIFAIFYSPFVVSRPPLVEALLVFGTINFPTEAPYLAAFQVAADFMLLAVFLAHIVGRVGRDDTKSPPQTTP
jgi:hypothetical protein